jgi:drug/metabolite transporter (DMT)-like permease
VKTGILQALGAAVLFGASAPLAKQLLVDISPQLLAGILYLGSGLGLGIWLVARRGFSFATEAPLHRSDLSLLGIAISFGGVIAPLLLMTGLQITAASTSSLLLNMETVFTALVAWFVFRENVDWRIVAGMIFIVAGGIVLSWSGNLDFTELRGPAAIAAACLCWAIDNNVTQKVSIRDPVQIAALKGVIAGAVNVAIAYTIGVHWPGFVLLAAGLLLGFLSYGVSLVLYILALRKLGTARAGNYFSVAPFVGTILAVIVWHEPMTRGLVAAGILMAIGLWLHVTEHHEHPHVHEPMRHEHLHIHDEHHQHRHEPDDAAGEPHSHVHEHERLEHTHAHYPDIHHRHDHEQ